MKKYNVYAIVTGSKYLGQVEADSPEEAEEKGYGLPTASIGFCHQCDSECEDPTITEITVSDA